MVNLSILSRCNRRCEFCFSRGLLPGDAKMDLAMFADILRRLPEGEQAGRKEIRFLGGEPTLHPDLPEMIEMAGEQGWRSVVFTNGMTASTLFDQRKKLQKRETLFVVNPGDWDMDRELPQRLVTFLDCFSAQSMPGVTILDRRQPLVPILDRIDDFGLVRSIRLGLAHPAGDRKNRFLHPKFYRETGLWILEFLSKAAEREVECLFDCGFVPCMFETKDPHACNGIPEDLGLRCNPLPDILPDGSLVPCYPLARDLSFPSWPEGVGLDEVRERMCERLQPWHDIGIYPYCRHCAHRSQGRCLGGCRAAAFLRVASYSGSEMRDRGTGKSAGAKIIKGVLSGRWQKEDSTGAGSAGMAEDRNAGGWSIPYIDQPIDFWEELADDFGPWIREVYFPFPENLQVESGRPVQPQNHLSDFLRRSPLPVSVLINPILLRRPAEKMIPHVLQGLWQLMDLRRLAGATVSSVPLAAAIRETFPSLRLTASTLLDISTPIQVAMLGDIFDVLVPSSRILRDLASLGAVRRTFPGAIRLIVNEGCLPGCIFRVQHFYEMGSGTDYPRSLCEEFLDRHPELRLLGAWILPQHLPFYQGLFDELKLAGRVTLQEPESYRKVLEHYIRGFSLMPHQIGGGPATVQEPMDVSEEMFRDLLERGPREMAGFFLTDRSDRTSWQKAPGTPASHRQPFSNPQGLCEP